MTRILDALESIARTGELDFHAWYGAKVLKDHADGHLDLQPDDARLPLFSRTPIRTGLPGVTVEVVKGARVLIGFDGGNPAKPFAALFESGSLKNLKIETTADLMLEVAGKATIHATVDVVLESAAKTTIHATGDVVLESAAKTTVKAAGDVVLEATGTVKLNGAASISGVLTEATQFTVVTDFFSGAGTATPVPGTSSQKVRA
jgi:hypothetical protein